jgi:hypothetical protein
MKMKTLNITICDCKQCPFYRRFGQRAAPGCSHFSYRNDAFGVRELPNKDEIDPYNGAARGVFVGEIPDWCPLDDVTPNAK